MSPDWGNSWSSSVEVLKTEVSKLLSRLGWLFHRRLRFKLFCSSLLFHTNASFNYCFSLSSLPLPLLLSKKRAWKRLRHRDVGMRPSLSFEAALVVHVSLQDFKLRIHSTCPCDVEIRVGFMDGLHCLVSSLVYKFCSPTSSRKSIVRTLFYIHLYTPWMF